MNKSMKKALDNKFDLNQFFAEKTDKIDWYFALNELVLNPVFKGKRESSKHVILSQLIFDSDFLDKLCGDIAGWFHRQQLANMNTKQRIEYIEKLT